MEHLKFFDLPADPFQNEADVRFYYESAPQKRARLRLLRGVHQKKALSVLTGGPGLGKTTLAHALLRSLDPKQYAAHYLSIPHESCASGWFLPNVARAIGVQAPAAQMQTLVDQIHAQLVAVSAQRRAVVLLVDEAQLFRNRDAMEEFRGLLNLLHGGKKLVSLVLFGLRELGDTLRLDPPLAQRVEIKVELTAMDWLESQAYVAHRLRLAGATQAVFAPDALEALFRWSGGVPRVLNTLADNALFEAFLNEARPVDSSIVATAAEGLGLALSALDDPYPSMPSLQSVAPAKSAAPAAPAADWLEPLAPMPSDTSDIALPPASKAFAELETELTFGDDDSQSDAARRETFVEALTEPAFEAEEEDAVVEPLAEAAEFELEEVVAEESSPSLSAVEVEPEAEPAFEAEEEPTLEADEEAVFEAEEEPTFEADEEAAPERQPAEAAAPAASDDSDWTLGSLLTEEEPPDLAAIVPASKRAERSPAPAPARTAERQRNEDSFDLRSLAAEVEAEPASDEDNLDALFDEIRADD